MLPALSQWQDSLDGTVTLAAIFTGRREAVEQVSEQRALSTVLVDPASEVSGLYGIHATPSGVMVEADGTVPSGPAQGPAAIEALIRTAIRRTQPSRSVTHAG
jgi:hypothetical protein